MNKLTITEKVFVPVSDGRIDTAVWKYNGIKSDKPKEFIVGVKEETNKYVLSKEQMEQVIMKAVEMAREGIVVHRLSEWETEKEFDYTDLQIINSIL